jgi:hypothetical protein
MYAVHPKAHQKNTAHCARYLRGILGKIEI